MATAIQSRMMADFAGDDRIFRKVFRRIIWFLFILLVVSFMDRVNIAFAALTMNKDSRIERGSLRHVAHGLLYRLHII